MAQWLKRSPRSGRQGFDSLVETDQKTLKVGIHSFLAWRFSIKKG